ncbi:MAG: hypothetical protein NWQ07_09550 [Flaviramulus sp.]|nr:hypothetical protein [Flaviramulus sp.]
MNHFHYNIHKTKEVIKIKIKIFRITVSICFIEESLLEALSKMISTMDINSSFKFIGV